MLRDDGDGHVDSDRRGRKCVRRSIERAFVDESVDPANVVVVQGIMKDVHVDSNVVDPRVGVVHLDFDVADVDRDVLDCLRNDSHLGKSVAFVESDDDSLHVNAVPVDRNVLDGSMNPVDVDIEVD